jgi:hypothetical protein
MAQSVVLGFTKQSDAQALAQAYRTKQYRVLIIGPTDQALFARENEDGSVWRSGPTADLFLMIATKDPLIGPDGP